MYIFLIWCMRISQNLDIFFLLALSDFFFLLFSFPFSLSFYSPYLLLFVSFFSAVKSLGLIADKA